MATRYRLRFAAVAKIRDAILDVRIHGRRA
jgi:hypothetical protein